MLQDWAPRGAWYDEYVLLVKRGHQRMAALESQGQATIAHYTAWPKAVLQCAQHGLRANALDSRTTQTPVAGLNGFSSDLSLNSTEASAAL